MSPPSSPKLAHFVRNWAGTTAIGWIGSIPSALVAATFLQIFGAVFWENPLESIEYPRWPDSMLSFFVPLGAAIAINSLYGYRQWHIALKLYVQKRNWILATHFSMITVWMAVSMVGNVLPPVFRSYGGDLSGLNVGWVVLETWYSALIFGGTFGLFMGLPQWWVLRKHLRLSILWLATVILASGTAAVLIVPIAQILKNIYLTVACSCVAMPLMFAVLTGFALYQILRHSSPTDEKSSVSS